MTEGDQPLKWTMVRYQAKPKQAYENQRLSKAVFRELAAPPKAGEATVVGRYRMLTDGAKRHD